MKINAACLEYLADLKTYQIERFDNMSAEMSTLPQDFGGQESTLGAIYGQNRSSASA